MLRIAPLFAAWCAADPGSTASAPRPGQRLVAPALLTPRIIVGQNMAAQWNGSIVVESKSGANGSIAAEEVARSAPDGYTWLLVTTFFTSSPALDAKLRWDRSRSTRAAATANTCFELRWPSVEPQPPRSKGQAR
jgi:tripartite-type tricarboxylate transporter receptor subunit TctC